MPMWKTVCLLGAVLSLVSGAARAQTCGGWHGYIWNLCVVVTNETQGTLVLEYKWNLWDNSWGLGDPLGNTSDRPPDTIAPGATIWTGSNAPMGGNVHMKLQYVIHDAAGGTLGFCLIDADSTYPGHTSGMTLTYNCDTNPDVADIVWDKDSQAIASFSYRSDGIEDCRDGLLAVSYWKIENASGHSIDITKLAGWNAVDRVWEVYDAEIDAYRGSDSYQLAVSNTRLRDKTSIFVRTCADEAGSKQPDGSLYLGYRVEESATTPGPEVTIGWSGTGKVPATENYTVNSTDNIVTITGG